MLKNIAGSFPKKIEYVITGTTTVSVGIQWEIESTDPKITVSPAFVIESNDKIMLQQATKFHNYNYYKQNNVSQKTIIVNNLNINNIKIISLEYRSDAGRVYKVLIDDIYFVDIKDELLMDVIFNDKIIGGKLQGNYIWVKIRGKMKLVRVGSKTYNAVKDYNDKKELSPLSKNKLEIGGVYRSMNGTTAIYCGIINSTEFGWAGQNNQFNFPHITINKQMLFSKFSITNNEVNVPNDIISSFSRKTHSFIEKVGHINLPTNIISLLRNKAIIDIKKQIIEYGKKQNYWFAYNLRQLSIILNMYKFGDEKVEIFEVTKYLNFI